MSDRVRAANEESLVRAARDERLIDAFRGGKPEAFDELVRAYESTVHRLLAQLNATTSDIEDLTQDVFLRVFRNLHRFRGQASFYTWLYRITVNVFFDHSKKRKRADLRLARIEANIIDASNQGCDPHDPYQATVERLANESLARAIDALPEAFRGVTAMREVDDLSYEEIATVAGISIGTVRSRLSRARRRLAETLRPALETTAA